MRFYPSVAELGRASVVGELPLSLFTVPAS